MTVITHPLINSLRCLKTDNICGTDTWEINNPCMCEPCQEYLQRNRGIPSSYGLNLGENPLAYPRFQGVFHD